MKAYLCIQIYVYEEISVRKIYAYISIYIQISNIESSFAKDIDYLMALWGVENECDLREIFKIKFNIVSQFLLLQSTKDSNNRYETN